MKAKGDKMLEDGEEGSGKREVRYVWDPQKLAWVEVAGAPTKEVVVEPWKEPEVEQVTPEEVPGENVQAVSIPVSQPHSPRSKNRSVPKRWSLVDMTCGDHQRCSEIVVISGPPMLTFWSVMSYPQNGS